MVPLRGAVAKPHRSTRAHPCLQECGHIVGHAYNWRYSCPVNNEGGLPLSQHHVDVDLDPETYEALAAQARQQGVTVTEHVAEILRVYRLTSTTISRRYAAMMRQEHGVAKVKVREFKDGLSAYIDRASAGEHLVILKGNTPSAMLVPLPPSDRRPGSLLSMMSAEEGRGLLSALERGVPEDEAAAADDPSWFGAKPAAG